LQDNNLINQKSLNQKSLNPFSFITFEEELTVLF